MINMKIKNMTPDAITIFTDSRPIVIEPSGSVARVTVYTEIIDSVDGINITRSVFGEVRNLPEPETGVIYIVPSWVAHRCKDRNDVFVPDEIVWDENCRTIGYRSLRKISEF